MATPSTPHFTNQGSVRSSTPAFGEQGKSQATDMLETVKDKAQDFAEAVTDKAGEVWDSTRRGVQQASNAVAETAGEAFSSVTGFMSRYPLTTFFAGCGLGILLTLACPAYQFVGRDRQR